MILKVEKEALPRDQPVLHLLLRCFDKEIKKLKYPAFFISTTPLALHFLKNFRYNFTPYTRGTYIQGSLIKNFLSVFQTVNPRHDFTLNTTVGESKCALFDWRSSLLPNRHFNHFIYLFIYSVIQLFSYLTLALYTICVYIWK